MWERFRRRRRTRRSEVVGQAMLALGNVRRRFGSSRIGRGRGAKGNVMGVGIGALAIAAMVMLAFWLLRRRRARGTASVIPEPEEGLEAATLEEEDGAPPAAPSTEDVSQMEERPPGEKRHLQARGNIHETAANFPEHNRR